MNELPFQREPAVLMRVQTNMALSDCEYREFLRQAHTTVTQVTMALENITDPFEIDGIVLDWTTLCGP